MDLDDDLGERLRRLGSRPIDPGLRSAHLTRAALVTPRRRAGRLAVAMAAAFGFFAGSFGLASTGALPEAAQDVAHDVFSKVGLNVPRSNRGQCVSAAARAHPDDEAARKAAKAACTKAGAGPGGGPVVGGSDPCKGPPPWAGRGKPTAEEKAAFGAGRAACPPEDEAVEAPEREEPEGSKGSDRSKGSDGSKPAPAPAPAPTAPDAVGPTTQTTVGTGATAGTAAPPSTAAG